MRVLSQSYIKGQRCTNYKYTVERKIVAMLAREYRKVVIEYHNTSLRILKICYKRVREYDNEYQLYIKAKSLLSDKS